MHGADNIIDRVSQIATEIEDEIVGYRRDFHRHAESGWTEFRTASLIARRLSDLGYEVKAGREVIEDGERMGLPAPEVLEERWQRAAHQGGDAEFLETVRGGFTGVVATLQHGQGPTVGLRFDIDAVDIQESQHPDHRPVREGFASVNDDAMHACGHDGHAAIGLGVAKVLMRLKTEIQGTVKLVFQPAEEGVRGAKAMVAAGAVDDVDYMLGAHLYSGWELGQFNPGRRGYLATTKFDAILEAAATIHDCTLAIKAMGGAQSADSDAELAERVAKVAEELGGFSIRPPDPVGGSEDYTYMMNRVQERGGLATNIGIGADLGGWGHHTAEFDIDERALKNAVMLLASTVLELMTG
jgi:metal-dependent amidase/aminoacylase/carboxypeptidase family protein